jgi:hypothetical protein
MILVLLKLLGHGMPYSVFGQGLKVFGLDTELEAAKLVKPQLFNSLKNSLPDLMKGIRQKEVGENLLTCCSINLL